MRAIASVRSAGLGTLHHRHCQFPFVSTEHLPVQGTVVPQSPVPLHGIKDVRKGSKHKSLHYPSGMDAVGEKGWGDREASIQSAPLLVGSRIFLHPVSILSLYSSPIHALSQVPFFSSPHLQQS